MFIQHTRTHTQTRARLSLSLSPSLALCIYLSFRWIALEFNSSFTISSFSIHSWIGNDMFTTALLLSSHHITHINIHFMSWRLWLVSRKISNCSKWKANIELFGNDSCPIINESERERELSRIWRKKDDRMAIMSPSSHHKHCQFNCMAWIASI